MTDQSSHFVINPANGTALHGMTFNGVTVPDVHFANSAVTVQDRAQITTTLAALKFFIGESRYWSEMLEPRMPVIIPAPSVLSIISGLSFTATGQGDRIDAVTCVADISAVSGDVVHIDLAWDRASGNLVVGPRSAATMLWADWLQFLATHEQFISMVETGHR